MNPASCRAVWRCGGFALSEMLVALAIMSLFTMVGLTTLRIGTSLWNRSQRDFESARHFTRAQHLVRDLIEHAYPMVTIGSDFVPHAMFHGRVDGLEFVARMAKIDGRSGYHHVRIAQTPKGLSLASAPVAVGTDAESPAYGPETPVAVGLRFAFSYFGKIGESPSEWHPLWDGQPTLPALVRILITDDHRSWPPLLIAPRIDVDATCVYDPQTSRCQGR